MKLNVLLFLVIICSTASVECRQVRQTNQIAFDDDLPEDINLNRIAELPVRYSPFTYHQKYFPEPTADSSFSYNYNSPKSPRIWARTFPNCGGSRQSPINLMTENCHPAPLRSLESSQYDLSPQSVIMENNGHSIEFTFEYSGARPLLSGGPLRSTYVFEQLHFHWGPDATQGSEHFIDSLPGEMEMHVVHRNAKYGNMSEAQKHGDGIVVLGFLFKTDNFAQDRELFRGIPEVRERHTSSTLQNAPRGFTMRDIVGPLTQRFVGYQGSLTTPPCSEAVSWLVAQQMQPISPRDMENFRAVLVERAQSMAPNYRPLQDWNRRRCIIF